MLKSIRPHSVQVIPTLSIHLEHESSNTPNIFIIIYQPMRVNNMLATVAALYHTHRLYRRISNT
jgi:hypothetical protein